MKHNRGLLAVDASGNVWISGLIPAPLIGTHVSRTDFLNPPINGLVDPI